MAALTAKFLGAYIFMQNLGKAVHRSKILENKERDTQDKQYIDKHTNKFTYRIEKSMKICNMTKN